MRIVRIFAALLLWYCVGGTDAVAQNIIPKPVLLERSANTDSAVLLSYPTISVDSRQLSPLAGYLFDYLPAGTVMLALDEALELPAEGYRLEVGPERVVITGKDYGGVWNGIQTFLQLLPPEVYNGGLKPGRPLTLPVVTIEDYPAMEYRGVMLDVARTFVPKEQVLRFIDNIAHHKINKLHWHLADDEGWRIEIKSLPRLTEIGAWRGPDEPLRPVYGSWDSKYGGFYTQDDIREIVAYAAVRNVEVIPEIDLPGHSRAAAIAYPEILCNYTPSLTASAGYDRRNVWCVAREENYAMLDTILREVAGLFPSKYIHLGGDEVETGQWRQCPDCKALMVEHGITDPVGLEDVFMERAVGIVHSLGKDAGVWVEASYRNRLDRTALVYSWKGDMKLARKTAASGYPTVVCAGDYFYFDMRQSPDDVGHIWAGIVTLPKVYSFDLAAQGFTPDETKNVRGVEATFFSELLLENGSDFLDYQMFPRVCALAEVAWTPAGQRSWDDFNERLHDSADGSQPSHFARLNAMGIKYRSAPPVIAPKPPRKMPAVTFTSSLAENLRYPFGGVSSYKTAARTTAACTEGDWFLWTFAAPVAASRIDIKTGYDHLQRAGVPQGRVEVSYDGNIFEKVGSMHDLKADVSPDPDRPVRAVRIVNESYGNGEPFVIIQPLVIY